MYLRGSTLQQQCAEADTQANTLYDTICSLKEHIAVAADKTTEEQVARTSEAEMQANTLNHTVCALREQLAEAETREVTLKARLHAAEESALILEGTASVVKEQLHATTARLATLEEVSRASAAATTEERVVAAVAAEERVVAAVAAEKLGAEAAFREKSLIAQVAEVQFRGTILDEEHTSRKAEHMQYHLLLQAQLAEGETQMGVAEKLLSALQQGAHAWLCMCIHAYVYICVSIVCVHTREIDVCTHMHTYMHSFKILACTWKSNPKWTLSHVCTHYKRKHAQTHTHT